MKNNTITILGLIALVAIVLVVWGSPGNSTENNIKTTSASEITVVNPLYDFGEIDILGGKVSTEYVLKNEGAEDVEIVSAVTSCVCTEGEIGGLRFGMHESRGGNVVIPAGNEKILTAIYDPLAHGPNGVGPVKRELFLKTNSTATPDIKVQFTANVIKQEG
ncbi:hypothetical protein CL654_01925 [bacterium]|nr:hypothetical protein [bacterium]|tara:strand:+ start:18327 stop:18812 length:486 start_codon:yes stop_codon:yes gene_type:complete